MRSISFQIFFAFLLVLSLLSPSLSEKCHPIDKKALLKVYNALNKPYDLIQWQPDTDCCEWYGVKCDERTNRVTTIGVSNADLKLSLIPANEIAEIPYLTSLGLYRSNLTGQIPQALTKLTNLTDLDLRGNHLTGPVPSFLGQLKKLEYLGLSSNKLTGTIPASLSQLTSLTGLLLDRNQLTGPIPDTFGDFKGKEIYMYLSHNQLSGKIPTNLGNAGFNYMDLSWNKLEGDISFLSGRKKTIRNVFLSRNQLSFDFSKFTFPKNLEILQLNNNKITGSLPQDLVNLKGLHSFDVSYNSLCGKIPAGGHLQEFSADSYSHNKCLCGAPLPACKKVYA